MASYKSVTSRILLPVIIEPKARSLAKIASELRRLVASGVRSVRTARRAREAVTESVSALVHQPMLLTGSRKDHESEPGRITL